MFAQWPFSVDSNVPPTFRIDNSYRVASLWRIFLTKSMMFSLFVTHVHKSSFKRAVLYNSVLSTWSRGDFVLSNCFFYWRVMFVRVKRYNYRKPACTENILLHGRQERCYEYSGSPSEAQHEISARCLNHYNHCFNGNETLYANLISALWVKRSNKRIDLFSTLGILEFQRDK